MRILIVSAMTQRSQTGVTAHYNRLIAGLSDQGETVTLLTQSDAPRLVQMVLGVLGKLSSLFGPYARIVFFEFTNFVSIWLVVRMRGSHQFDLVHAQDVNSGAAAALALGHKIGVIATCHFNDDPLTEHNDKHTISPWVSRRLSAWYTYLFRQHDGFITVSEYIKKTSARLRPANVPCEVIQNSVEFPDLKPKPTTQIMSILNIGTVEERKNQRLLIEAAAELVARGFTQFNVRFFGDGPKRAAWQQLIDEKGLGAHVVFEGFRTDVATQLEGATLYVHTALNESWGYSITEAIASGTPVLALETGGIPEQFGHHKPGLLPKETSAAELATAILRYRDEAERRQLADDQGGFARERFNLSAMIQKHLAFYQQIVGSQSVPPTNKTDWPEKSPAKTTVNL